MREFAKKILRKLGLCRDFLTGEWATITVESVIILPVMFTALISFYVFFDVFHQRSIATKAHYAVADYLGRVRQIDEKTIDGLAKIYRTLTHSDDRSFVRVHLLRCHGYCDDSSKRIQRWVFSYISDNTDGETRLSKALRDEFIDDQVPIMFQFQWVIAVETNMHYESPLDTVYSLITPKEFYDFSAFSHRFVEKLDWVGSSAFIY